jgi:hypothetical protein
MIYFVVFCTKIITLINSLINHSSILWKFQHSLNLCSEYIPLYLCTCVHYHLIHFNEFRILVKNLQSNFYGDLVIIIVCYL